MKNTILRFAIVFVGASVVSGCESLSVKDAENGSPVLKVSSKIYPNPKKHLPYAGEPVSFELSLKPSSDRIDYIILNFGDGREVKQDLDCDYAKSIECEDAYFMHVYDEPGVYHPSVRFYYQTVSSSGNAISGRFKEVSKKDGFDQVVAVSPEYKSDEQFLRSVYREGIVSFVEQVKHSFAEKGRVPKVALGIYNDADFEYRDADQGYFDIVQETATVLVDSGVDVLERHPQALTRLARESVKAMNEKTKEAENSYLEKREYSLVKPKGTDETPLKHDLRMEGVNDRVELFSHLKEITNGQSQDVKKEEGKSVERVSGVGATLKEMRDKLREAEAAKTLSAEFSDVGESADLLGGLLSTNDANVEKTINYSTGNEKLTDFITKEFIDKTRPLLITEFDTADYVILIEPMKWEVYHEEGNDYFDVDYKSKMKKRVAKISLTMRVLSRSSLVPAVEYIELRDSDFVIPGFFDDKRGVVVKIKNQLGLEKDGLKSRGSEVYDEKEERGFFSRLTSWIVNPVGFLGG